MARNTFARPCSVNVGLLEAGEIISTIRIDDGYGFRKFFIGLVMINDDGIKPKPSRFGERFEAGNTTIDRDQQLCAAFGERTDGIHIRSVTFENTVRDVNDRIEPAVAQIPAEQRRGCGTVDVIVTKDRGAFAPDNGVGDP